MSNVVANFELEDGKIRRDTRKKLDEGKSRKEALRCLKRRVSDAVFRRLLEDSQAASRGAA